MNQINMLAYYVLNYPCGWSSDIKSHIVKSSGPFSFIIQPNPKPPYSCRQLPSTTYTSLQLNMPVMANKTDICSNTKLCIHFSSFNLVFSSVLWTDNVQIIKIRTMSCIWGLLKKIKDKHPGMPREANKCETHTSTIVSMYSLFRPLETAQQSTVVI